MKKWPYWGQNKRDQLAALYLKDNNKPLVLVGGTRIDGKAYLPKRGVKSGNIAGYSPIMETNLLWRVRLSVKNFHLWPKIMLQYIEWANS